MIQEMFIRLLGMLVCLAAIYGPLYLIDHILTKRKRSKIWQNEMKKLDDKYNYKP